MTHVLLPGSYDPPTLGHLDVITTAAQLFDHVTVAVVVNPAKTGLLPIGERQDLLREMLDGRPHITVDSFEGLLVDYCREHQVDAIIKGIRSGGDVDYELPMAHMNHHLAQVPTLLLPGAARYSFVSSSLVKQVAALGGDISALVPACVIGPMATALGRPPSR